MSEKRARRDEEPLLLTMLPFAGLALLLVLALVWRVIPDKSADAGDGSASPEVRAEALIDAFESASEQSIPIDPEKDFSHGPEDAAVTLVVFSDFECPYCRTAAIGLADLVDARRSDLRVVFKNFPLDTACNDTMTQPLHTFACEAASLAQCAGREQGDDGFWTVHDALFAASKLHGDVISAVKERVGIAPETLEACMSSEETLTEIREDIAQGRKLGVSGTPAIFANGRRISDYRPDAIAIIIDHVLSSR